MPGFIAQLKGKLTNKRYNTATIFIYHFSDLSYVHLQQSTSSVETLEAKRTFEAYSKEKGVRIEHCHADNGIFADNAFINSVKEKTPKYKLLWCKRPLAKWSSRKEDQGFSRRRSQTTFARKSKMVESHYAKFMALCSLDGKSTT